MGQLLTAHSVFAVLTLTVLEIVLGVDNIIFLAIVTAGVPRKQQPLVRRLGLSLALVGRIVMVLGVAWLLGLNARLFALPGHAFSAKDLVLLGGGVFLVYKAVTELYKTTELKEEGGEAPRTATPASTAGVVVQIMLVDMVFAIDSVLTAVGLTREVVLIIVAMTIAILAMMFFADPLSDFINEHPSLKILALAFLVLVGVLLISDGFGREVDRTYVYFAILFSLGVEALNFRRRKNLQREAQSEGPTGV
jgi:predicted tellurium resistance membrane protein TerC